MADSGHEIEGAVCRNRGRDDGSIGHKVMRTSAAGSLGGKALAFGRSMQPIDVGIAMLVLHGLLGGFDTLYNHEWDARLPLKLYAARELTLHAGRSAIYGLVFAGLAWFE
jgi:hypothetical protein